MSQPNTQRHLAAWKSVCNETDLVSNSGVVVWLDGAQVALFYLPGAQDQTLYAIDNHDPESGANVIGRGLVGSIKGELVVAAPIYKQHYRLQDGQCLEAPNQRLRVWPVRLNGGVVELGVN
ncbi:MULTISPECIES: nitrite reductase small subunit NirD [Pseudomonas]|jgi:nitrite reductase (NADH) small subunit|uniref:Nitrite reductase small subunit NirD n=2 Tax=Pseudomonas TaxID=286 RepID=A0A4Y9TE39_PSEFL|nr:MULTISPECIES: nitrite reductase small subunit NirD [Pseudomonas]CRM91372.1 Nitrite reductase [NAD(P)H] small subunit [Pseudomonas sp. 22 E 5]MCX9154371.1 nitrite reductase small subunit NirD [Pseudomonas sp. TB1-B1]QXH64725.1 nitrite reductase small subunit NirD [Pseudomonas asgharzadehiana]TFW42675.1 nitrite reductase small subunit NirD [Pseudomonas fluorescens]TKJ59400.1 nitrite reductase (NAD(P)H) small subunit [Pseudomonas sp. CFBP13506]